MSGVKRYEFEVDDRYLCDCGNGSRIIPVAIDTGEYVLASDYDRDTQALISELAALKAQQPGATHDPHEAWLTDPENVPFPGGLTE